MKTTPPRPRLTRDEAKAETRRRLLNAARNVFLRDGYHGATIDAIAEEAGYTKGAVYSAFASKADFFLALYGERQIERRKELARHLAAGSRGGSRTTGPQLWAASLRRDRSWLLLLMEFWVHAARDADLAARFAKLHSEVRRTYCDAIRRVVPEFKDAAEDEVERIARATMALGNGYALESFLDPAGDLPAEYLHIQAALDRGLLPGARSGPAS